MAKYRNWGIVAVAFFALLAFVVRGDFVITGGQLSSFGSGSASSSSLNTSLIAYWKLDETSGTRYDSEPTGTAQDLTDNNTVGYSAGIVSNSATFASGANESFTRAASVDLSFSNTSASVTLWVKPNSSVMAVNRYLISKTESGTGDEYGIDMDSGFPRFWIATNTTYIILTNTTALQTNSWNFLACVYDKDAATISLSVNGGTIVSKSVGSTTPDFGGSVFRVGSYRTTSYYVGEIDEVGFWKKVLTPSEITELYNSGAGKTCCPF